MDQTPDRTTVLLARLARLSRDLVGAFRPATAIEHLARMLTEVLAPDRVSIIMLDADNRLAVAHDTASEAARTDDPLLQLALRRGPLLFSRDVAVQAAQLGADVGAGAPSSWIGVPLLAEGRPVGAVSLSAGRADAFQPQDLTIADAAVAQVAMALENTRLLALLSIAKREWEETVDAISPAICIVDAHGVVRRANRVFAQLVGTAVTAIPGRAWLGLLPPAWAEPVGRAVSERTASTLELKVADRSLLFTAIPLTEPAAAVLVFEDQTEKRRLQEQLIQSEKMSAIGQLIAGIAHDLNNPLASVVGFSDFLAESGDVPAALTEPLEVIRQEAERAATIVRNLLSFARSREGERDVELISRILESTLALMRNDLMARNVDAVIQLEPDLPSVRVNANQITQVFVNLISNAAQAIASANRSGMIRIAARRWLDGVAVSVGDNGPGIPEDVLPRVFEPFFTTKKEGEGTGLGLSICQGIVKEHGGRITAESRPGGGATFTVELPGAAAPRPAAASLEPLESVRPLRVLVVDDEPHILYYMRSTLESWGHAVEVASDGAYALERALADSFDVIICDLRMPHLGGREMYQRLARQHPQTARRIIFATGDTVRGDTLQFLEGLGRPYLHKPFTLTELRSMIARVAAPAPPRND